MRDEDIRDDENVNAEDELEQYIKENPDDLGALVFSAWCQENQKWNNSLKIINEQIVLKKQQILILENQICSIGKLKNLYRKVLGRSDHIDAIQERINNLQEEVDNLTVKAADLVLSQPQEWQYKLALHGNNLFRAQ